MEFTPEQIKEAELNEQRIRLLAYGFMQVPLDAQHKKKIDEAKLAAKKGEASILY
jgi:hypothetical protein